ncbi:NKAP domain containing 1 isoform X1 [Poeciliopsis prolifica]|uniref:NKAP domain containing 1 isoform X1 n=2 Tax=Poeciliopsis prolifica TaxID=188132 RepID=UPI0024131AEF|nr:NKAP domain containing 1 isoform X1 [Poeciliopsis prolifica]XP_054901529.1 NKAP domain containing 1 isoform X1 [Poeciliopsis prolifica]
MDVGLSSGVAMAKQPLGKTLLRNVIRHTDAHNKIQEEMEMWKMRDWEIQASDHKHLPSADIMRGGMHCDRVSDHPRNTSAGRERVSEHDDREARYWTRRLYEFEAGDPDRWGHSGFKELYPEEFDSESDKSVAMKKKRRCKMKKSKSDTEACLSKRSKKSSRKKKKKKKKKVGSSSDDSGTDDRSETKDKQRKKKRGKGRHKNKKSVKTRRRDEDSSSEDSSSRGRKERQANGHKKRKHDSLKDSDSGLDSKKKRRKNWKEAGEENSNDSSND